MSRSGDGRMDGAAEGPSADTDARIQKHAERLARARSSPKGLRSALLDALDDEEDLPVGPLLREAKVFPPEPPPPDAVLEEARTIFDAQDAQSAPRGWFVRARRWWQDASKPWVLGSAGLAAAAAVLALVVVPGDAKIGPEPFAAALAEADTDSRKVVLEWALTLAAEGAPEARGALLADATSVLRSTGAKKGPGRPLSPELEERLARLRATANAETWRDAAQAALEDAPSVALDRDASRDVVFALGRLLRAATPDAREAVDALARRWVEKLDRPSRARLAYDVGRYMQRAGDAEAARAWYERALASGPTLEVRSAAERRLEEL